MILEVKTFRMDCTDKEQAVKVLEEAAEVLGAWQVIDECSDSSGCVECGFRPDNCCAPHDLADEIADVIQAACNLAARYGIDMAAAMERCERRNRERGRYERS